MSYGTFIVLTIFPRSRSRFQSPFKVALNDRRSERYSRNLLIYAVGRHGNPATNYWRHIEPADRNVDRAVRCMVFDHGVISTVAGSGERSTTRAKEKEKERTEEHFIGHVASRRRSLLPIRRRAYSRYFETMAHYHGPQCDLRARVKHGSVIGGLPEYHGGVAANLSFFHFSVSFSLSRRIVTYAK